MKFNIIAVLVGLALFGSVATASISASTVVTINDLGTVTVPDNVTIQKGEQKTLIAAANQNNLSEYLGTLFSTDGGSYYQVVAKNNEHFSYGLLTTQVVGLLTLQQLGLIDDTTPYLRNSAAYFPAFMKAVNTYMAQTPPAQYVLIKPFTERKQGKKVWYDGCIQYMTIVNGSECTELIYVTVMQRQSYIVVTALMGNGDEDQNFLLPLMNVVKSVK